MNIMSSMRIGERVQTPLVANPRIFPTMPSEISSNANAVKSLAQTYLNQIRFEVRNANKISTAIRKHAFLKLDSLLGFFPEGTEVSAIVASIARVVAFIALSVISPITAAFNRTTKNKNFMDLPNEMMEKIFTTLSDRDLREQSSTNSRWNTITARLLDIRWKKLEKAISQPFPHSQSCMHTRKVCKEAFHNANSGTTASQRMDGLLKSLKIIDPRAIAQMVEECPELRSLFYNPTSFLHNLLFDHPLTVVWHKLKEQNSGLNLPNFLTATSIRKWIKAEEAKQIFSQIKEKLDLSRCDLLVLPPEIGQLSSLQELRLAENQLISLPVEIGQLTALQELHLDQNQLTSLPATVGQLTSLKVLHLDQNQLTSLPAMVGQLTSLQELHLDQNQLTSLPAEIGQLTSLKVLHLERNQLTSLPAEIGQLTALKGLHLDQNQLTSLPAEIGQLTALQELHLGRNQLISLPVEIGQLTALKVLFLWRNKLTSLPLQIGQMTALKVLHLGGNQLTSLPLEVGQLASLQMLDIGGNQLTSLPPEIGKLAALKKLHLKGNQLTSLPAEIGQLAALQELHLDQNQFTSLPPEIGKLVVL